MKLFDWALKQKGFPIDQAVKHFQDITSMPQDRIVPYQEDRKKEIVAFHRSGNPFYCSFLNKNGIDGDVPWEQLPIIRKSDMQIPLDERISDGYQLNGLFINNTSGSSGTPFYFAKDKFCHALTWACNKNRFGWHGIDFNKSWQARFYGIPLNRAKFYKEKIKDSLSHRVRFPIFNLSDEICERYVRKFEKTPFAYLNGYTSSLVLFAKYCISAKITLKEICPTLKICATTSEMCSDTDRQIMETGFGVKVVNEYGCAELDLLAFEDTDGDWLMNEENLFIEIIGEDGLPVPDGVSGRIIVTSLYNKAMPMIRYELGDVGTISTKSRKGIHRTLGKLTGRTNDVAILPSGRKAPGLTFYYVTKSLLEQGGTMKEFVIKQVASNTFILEYVAEADISEDQRNKVATMMETYLEPGLTLHFARKQKIERTTAGKLKQFQYLVNPAKTP